jgi:hypothetical protein
MKHDCDAIQLKVSEILDESGILPHELEKEVLSCKDCSHFYQMWKANGSLAEMAKQQSSFSISPYFYEKIASRSEEIVSSEKKKRNYAFLAGVAAIFVAAFTFGSFFISVPKDKNNTLIEATKPLLPQDAFSLPPLEKSFSKENINTGIGLLNDTTASSWRKAQTQISLVQDKFVSALKAL